MALDAGCRGSGQTVGGLLLHHDGEVLDGQAVAQQLHDDGAGDVVGQVGADSHRHPGELLLDEGAEVYFQNILQYQLEVIHARHGLGQQGRQALVHLDGHHLGGVLGQLFGQHADAGADLQHAPALIDAAGVHDLGRQAGIDDEVLSKALESAKSYFSHRVRITERSVSSGIVVFLSVSC